jgi:hypothetical protein
LRKWASASSGLRLKTALPAVCQRPRWKKNTADALRRLPTARVLATVIFC